MKRTKLMVSVGLLSMVLGVGAIGCANNSQNNSEVAESTTQNEEATTEEVKEEDAAAEASKSEETKEEAATEAATSEETKAEEAKTEEQTDSATVAELEIDHKYMEKANSNVVEDFSIDKADEYFYSAKPEDFEDENLKSLAQDYVKKGYFITDAKVINEVTGEGYCLGDYVFTTGFQVVDAKDGTESFKAEVLKMTAEEYALFIDDYFEDGEKYDEKKDGNTIEIKYDCNTLTYDGANEILIYESDLTGEKVG